MSKALVSVIIPVYNGELYLRECLESVKKQTFQNWDCIIVNDGSTDNSIQIIKEFAAKDPRFLYTSIANSGSAKVPIDTGIMMTESIWVCVVGQDDFLEPDSIELMLNRAEETSADIIYLRLLFFNEENPLGFKSLPEDSLDTSLVVSGEEVLMMTVPEWKIGANGALVKRSLWDKSTTLNKGLNLMNTDEYDTRELLSNAQIVAFANSIYHYRKHSESITAKFSIKYFDSLIIDKMLDNLFSNQFGADSPQTRLVRQYRLGEIINHQTTLFKTKKCLSGIEKKKAQKLIRENYSDIDKSKIFNESKIRRILYTKSYHLFITHTYINHLRKRIFCKE